MFVAEPSVGSAPVLFWAGVDTGMDEYDTSQINAGLLVEAGDGGGGAPVPGGCSRTSLVLFLLPGKRGPYLYSKERPHKHRGGRCQNLACTYTLPDSGT